MNDTEILAWFESVNEQTINTEHAERAVILAVRDLLAQARDEATVEAFQKAAEAGWERNAPYYRVVEHPDYLAAKEREKARKP